LAALMHECPSAGLVNSYALLVALLLNLTGLGLMK
jgi:hypothetical protein